MFEAFLYWVRVYTKRTTRVEIPFRTNNGGSGRLILITTTYCALGICYLEERHGTVTIPCGGLSESELPFANTNGGDRTSADSSICHAS